MLVIAMGVPTGHSHGDKAAAGFAEATGDEELSADGLGRAREPAFDVSGGVVLLNDARVLA